MSKNIKRAVDCGCGHTIAVNSNQLIGQSTALGEKLFWEVRKHVDEDHPDLQWSNRTIWIFLAEKSYNPELAK